MSQLKAILTFDDSWDDEAVRNAFADNDQFPGVTVLKLEVFRMECKVCGGLAVNRFNIDFDLVPVCEQCANAITMQQVEWLVGRDVCEKHDSKEAETQPITKGKTPAAPTPGGEIGRVCGSCGRRSSGTCLPDKCDSGYSGWIPV